jgi:acetylornithine/N-succinyldiaminopimelate aminotransferase
MGRTLAMSQVTDKPSFREGLPLTLNVDYVPFFQSHAPEESLHHALKVLKRYLARYPKQHAAMCFELIQGEGGFYSGESEFFIALMEVLKEHEVAIICDEVQTFGRTSNLFAYQYFNLAEYIDIATIGKLSQVCATLFRKEFKPKPGLLSQTFTSSTAAIKASKIIIHDLLHGGYLGANGKIVRMHAHFVRKFHALEAKYPGLIRGPYGIGAMVAFTPFDGSHDRVAQFAQDLFQAGVISFIAGSHPTRIRFLIPMGAITLTDIDNVIQIVERVLIK